MKTQQLLLSIFLILCAGKITGQDILLHITQPTCNEPTSGLIELEIVGELPPYTGYFFEWTDDLGTAIPGIGEEEYILPDLGPGSYCVEVVSPDDCLAEGCFTIESPTQNPIDISLDTYYCICEPDGVGMLSVNVTGGEPPYEYFWTGPNGYSSLEAAPQDLTTPGIYFLTIGDQGGCTNTQDFLVSTCNLPLFDEEVTQSCEGPGTGEIYIQMSEPTLPPYTFVWTYENQPFSDAASNPVLGTSLISSLQPGKYCLTVFTSNGCAAYQCWEINATDFPDYEYTITPEVNGNDGAIDLTLIGMGPFQYEWGDGPTTEDRIDIPAGSYHVVTSYNLDQSCSFTLPFEVYGCAELFSNISLSHTSTNPFLSFPSGSIDLTVSGAMGYTFDFLWSNGSTTEDLSGLSSGTYCVTLTHPACAGFTQSYCADVCQFGLSIEPTGNDPNPACTGMEMIAKLDNGTALFYDWDTGATTPEIVFPYGEEHCVTVTDDSGCKAVACATVQESPLDASAVVTHASSGAANGSIDLTVSGGFPPYSFDWDNGAVTEDINNLAPGYYCVRITDACSNDFNLCAYVECEIAQAEVAANITAVSCANGGLGSIDLDLSGVSVPNPSFQFLWSNGATTQNVSGLPAGEYCVGILETSTQCHLNLCYVIPQDLEDPFSLEFDNGVSCGGGSTGTSTVSADGAYSPYTYLWSNGNTTATTGGLAPGWHTVTVTDAIGCEVVGNTFIWEMQAFDISSSISDTKLCDDETATISVNPSGGTPPFSYQWQTCFPCSPIPGATNATITDLSAGIYYVLITDASGCAEEFGFKITNSNFNLNEHVENETCATPNSGSITLNVIGTSPPFSYAWDTGSNAASLSNLAAGTYCMTVTDNENCSTEQCFTVELDESVGFDVNATQIVPPTTGSAADGQLTVAATIGGNVSYSWNTGATGASLSNLSSGTYTVTATTSNGCTTIESFELDDCSSLPDFSVSVIVSDWTPGSSSATFELVLEEDGTSTPYTDIPAYYSIEWRKGLTTLGYGEPLSVTIQNDETQGFNVVVSNGCTEVTEQFLLIGCDENIAGVLQNYFLDPEGFELPCEGGYDGAIMFDFYYPDVSEVSILLDGSTPIPFPAPGDGENINFLFANLSAGSHDLSITLGECTYEFSFNLPTLESNLIFTGYVDPNQNDAEPGYCEYVKECDGIIVELDQQEEPTINWAGSSGFWSCTTPVQCDVFGQDVNVGNLSFNKRWARVQEYIILLQALSNAPGGYGAWVAGIQSTSPALGLPPCHGVRYCEQSMIYLSSQPFIPGLPNVATSGPSVNENGCIELVCDFIFNIEYCSDELVDQFGFPGLDFEFDNCVPISLNMLSLCENLDFLETLPDYENETGTPSLKSWLENNCGQHGSKENCATVWFCHNDFKYLGNNLNDITCGGSIPPDCVPENTITPNPEFCDPIYVNTDPIGDPWGNDPTQYVICPNHVGGCGIQYIYESSEISDIVTIQSGPVAKSIQGGNGNQNMQLLSPDADYPTFTGFGTKKSAQAVNPIGILTQEQHTTMYHLLPNSSGPQFVNQEAYHLYVEDWDEQYELAVQALDQQLSMIHCSQIDNSWAFPLLAGQWLEVKHLSSTEDRIFVAGTFSGPVQFRTQYLSQSPESGAFLMVLSMQGEVLKFETVDHLAAAHRVAFSENRNGEILLAGYFEEPSSTQFEAQRTEQWHGLKLIRFSADAPPFLIQTLRTKGYFELSGFSHSGGSRHNFSLLLSGKGDVQLNNQPVWESAVENSCLLGFDRAGTLQYRIVLQDEHIDTDYLALSTDQAGNTIIGLTFRDQIRLQSQIFEGSGSTDILLAAITPTGTINWTKVIASPEYEAVTHLMTDNGFIYFGGMLSGKAGQRTLGDLEFYNFRGEGKYAAFISHVNYQAEPQGESQTSRRPNTPSRTGKLEAFPNPFSDYFTVISTNDQIVEIRLFGILGQPIQTVSMPDFGSIEINLASKPGGFYILGAYDKFGNLVDQIKLVKEN